MASMEDITKEFDKTIDKVSRTLASQARVEDIGDGLFTLSVKKNVYNRIRNLTKRLLGHEDEIMAQIAMASSFEFKWNGQGIRVEMGDILTAKEVGDIVLIDAIDAVLALLCLSNMVRSGDTINSIIARPTLLKYRGA